MTDAPFDPRFAVRRAACTRCGLCAADCVVGAIDLAADGPVLARPDDCLRCQHCLAICPEGAVSIFGLDPADSPPNRDLPDPAAMRRLIHGRRSMRAFAAEDVPADVLRDLVDTAWHAPTGVNAQALHFAVVAARAAMDALRERVYARIDEELARADRAPTEDDETLREFCDDWKRERRDDVFRGAPHMVVASTSPRAVCGAADPYIALSTLDLYAASRGVGTMWCGLAMMALDACRDRSLWRAIGVPRGHRPAYAMMLGRPGRTYPRGVRRGPASAHFTGLDPAPDGA